MLPKQIEIVLMSRLTTLATLVAITLSFSSEPSILVASETQKFDSEAEPTAAGRKPLTFQDSGLYGGWPSYFKDPTTPFDYHIVQAAIYEGDIQSIRNWNRNFQEARANGKRIVAALYPHASDGKGAFFSIKDLTSNSTDRDLDKLALVVEEFLAEVDESELYGITLGEEHIYWNGREDHLNALYEKIKVNHPDLPIFQWYSPSKALSTPGISGFPNLNADGWVSDEYFLDQPNMEKSMRAYIIQQKPILNVIWAGGERQPVPYVQQRFDEQVSVQQKYNIPASYFTYSGDPGSGDPGLWGFKPDVDPITAARFENVLSAAKSAASYTGPDVASWDVVPWEIPAIELAFHSQSDATPCYTEDYSSDRVLRVINDTNITGFANLRWDSSPVELRPRKAGQAKSSVAYSFVSAFPLTELRVSAPGFITGGTDGAVSLSVRDSEGNILRTTTMTPSGSMDIVVPGASFPGRAFQVVYTMTGIAASAGDVLAGVKSIEVDADVVIPPRKAVDLEAGADNSVSFEEDLSGMSIYHTGKFTNIDKIFYSPLGLRANSKPGVLEVVQEFSSSNDILLSKLRIEGSADETSPSKATVGIGISLDGINVLSHAQSSGKFDGEMELDLSNLSIKANSFFVHLSLKGGYGLIKSYCIEGKAAVDDAHKNDNGNAN